MTALILFAVAFLLCGDIARQLHLDAVRSREARDLDRLTVPLPPERANLTTLPARVAGTNLDDELVTLARAGAESPAPSDETLGRLLAGLRRADDAPVALVRRRARPGWDTPTAEFHMIVGQIFTTAEYQALVRRWMCTSCDVGRDGERRHQSCTGCSCPCGVCVA
jgi:hypothetical protein